MRDFYKLSSMNSASYGVDIYELKESFPNLFSDKAEAEQFVENCNNEQLSAIHFCDYLEDFRIMQESKSCQNTAKSFKTKVKAWFESLLLRQ